jgi:steroid delta-isomerase-like uncharacterized protein
LAPLWQAHRPIYQEDSLMTVDQNKRIVSRYYTEVLNAGQLHLLDDLAADDYVEHDPFPGQGNGRTDLLARVTLLRSAFAPIHFTIEDIVAEADRVVARWSSSGRHSGEFLGIPPTGRDYTISGIDIHRLENGRIVEHWHVVDQLSQLQQLGLFPASTGG